MPKRDKNGNIIPDSGPGPVTITPEPSFIPGISEYGFIDADLFSLDTDDALHFLVPPNEFEYDGQTEWAKVGVVYGSPDPLEYQRSLPLAFTIHAVFDAYWFQGTSGSIKPELDKLEKLRKRVKGRNRAHIVMYLQGETRFIGVITRYHVSTRRIGKSGGHLQAPVVEITLEEKRLF